MTTRTMPAPQAQRRRTFSVQRNPVPARKPVSHKPDSGVWLILAICALVILSAIVISLVWLEPPAPLS